MTKVYNVVYDKIVNTPKYGTLYDTVSIKEFSAFNHLNWEIQKHVDNINQNHYPPSKITVDDYNAEFIRHFDERYTSRIQPDTVHVLILLTWQLISFKHQLERTGLSKYIVLETVPAINHNYPLRTPTPNCLTTLVLYFKGFKQP